MLCGAIINFKLSLEELMKFINKLSSLGQELPITIVNVLFLNSEIKSKLLFFSKIETTRSNRVSPETVTFVFPNRANNSFEPEFCTKK